MTPELRRESDSLDYGTEGSRGVALPVADHHRSHAPRVELEALDELWFQVAGTVCNLRCKHCFISCAPDNHSHWFMEREKVQGYLRESAELGVKEYYFTGGEPFMHREMEGILEDTLAYGPASVLTNATLMPERRAGELARIRDASPYTLELRVSLDGVTAEMNDAIRGEGMFERCLEGVERLVRHGFLPILTCMRSWPEADHEAMLARFRTVLAEVGYGRPRIKILPPILMGEEAERSRGYDRYERVTHEMMEGFDPTTLLCSRARLVSARGVHACPILLESPDALLGTGLKEAAATPVALAESACYTCYMSGSICSNLPTGAGEPSVEGSPVPQGEG